MHLGKGSLLPSLLQNRLLGPIGDCAYSGVRESFTVIASKRISTDLIGGFIIEHKGRWSMS